ncbi:MAG: radical SAM family heme chaperone HemW [Prevotellaceae bacterium]|nr:radical SAM family heme chaperone HemW [Prevotellaceae bacterium]
MAGIYIHIPFCASKCIYCGFYSSTRHLNRQDQYIKAVLKEMELRHDYLGADNVRTIYIGGGTPSLLSKKNLLLLSEKFNNNSVIEFTMECNPDDITPSLCETMSTMGVNRVSMGVQTFNDNILRFLHRRHTSAHILPAITMLRQAGIENISIDLMFGFPDETITQWQQDINIALKLNVQHISAYSLMYEEGTPLYQMLKHGEIKENKENCSAEMYSILLDTLSAAGYEHYEISNFALPGYRSIHNSCYWNDTHYIGLGAAAHSYNGTSRQWNVSDIDDYISSIESGCMHIEQETIDARTHYNDMVTTALRTREGINLNLLDKEQKDYIIKNARKCIDAGALTIHDNRMALTRKGLYISDDVMSELIWI